ncbi:MAG: hypothetical protein OHK0039_32340 [Bacteroidia bacterium]
MRTLLLTGLLLLCGLPLLAQSDETLASLNAARLDRNKTHMYILGGWALGNIAVSGYLRSQTSGSQRYFHEMNAAWNLVNLGLAAGGLYGSYTSDPTAFDLYQTLAEQQKLEKVLLFNLALNFTYMTAGAYLTERAKRPGLITPAPDRLKGYGQSLVLQGGFLLLFDTAQYFVHHSQATPALRKLLESVQAGPGGVSLSLGF